jgi:hypothetical protein
MTTSATTTQVPPAWIDIIDESDLRAMIPEGGEVGYDFGFLPAMGRLIVTHPRIGLAFMVMYSEIMFSPEGVLSRAEREMIAGVAAAAQDCFY